MNIHLLLALAVGPALILMHGIYVADRYEREPIRNLLRYLLAGALVGIPADIFETTLFKAVGFDLLRGREAHWLWLVPACYLGVAATEEVAKRGALYLRARRDPELDEPFDWVVYAVSIALGFATLENITYVLVGGFGVGVLRAFTAVPSHALDGTLMGDRLSRAALRSGPAAAREQWLAVVEPTLWHGTYDLLAFGAARAQAEGVEALATGLLGALAVLILAQWIVALRRVRAQQWVKATKRRVPPIFYPTLPFRRHHDAE